MTYIGIDQSINSTGICVNHNNEFTYHLIVPHITKKQQNVNNANRNVLIHSYPKDTLDINLKEICSIIAEIIANNEPDCVCFESISFGSNGRVVDLAQLAGYIRSVCDILKIPYTTIPPTSLKKLTTGNGRADKSLMIRTWQMLDPDTYELTKDIKQDDLADSFAMAMYLKNKLNPNAYN